MTAPPRKQIVLLGMPGVGKTTVGRSLARHLRLPFRDTDLILEHRFECSVSAFFQREGEARFREVEASLLRELVDEPEDAVIATGGGIVTRPQNQALIASRCIGIYLRSRPEQIFRRLRGDTRRPLLQVADPLARLRELHAQRDALYRQAARFTVEMHGVSLSNVVNKISMQLELAELECPSGLACSGADREAQP